MEAADDCDFAEKDPSGRYVRYDEILGKGAFKIVCKGFDEADGIESLKHENIIKLYNSWVDDKNKTINMITELFTSGSLRQYRKKHKNVDLKAIKNWARQILRGTPEFMAPELYDEEYNELVDIYSFGLCMLEMVTCEYPYNECKNPAQIYKKVTSGVKSASLGKVNDPQVKQFIEKCLLPASMRLPAVELLKDPFLLAESPKEVASGPLQLPNLMPKLVNLIQSELHPMDIDPNRKNLLVNSSAKSIKEAPWFSTLELQCFTENNEFRLKGEKNDDNTISFTLRISDQCGRARNIHFSFYLDSDTAILIAEEMVEQLDLSNEDVTAIAELIDSMIMKLVPYWKPSFGSISWLQQDGLCCPSRATIMTVGEQEIFSELAVVKCQDTQESVSSYISAESDGMVASDRSNNKPMGSSFYSYDIGVYNHFGQKATNDEENLGESVLINDSSKNSKTSLMDSCSFASQDMSLSSICSLSLAEKDNFDELKLALDAIDSQYHQCFQELMRMREEAMENALQKDVDNKEEYVRWFLRQNQLRLGTTAAPQRSISQIDYTFGPSI
ncbi:hypothetical protein CRYUN_Cryun19dG0107500 [Craigia yunnanensis]